MATKWKVISKDGAYVYPVPRAEGQAGYKKFNEIVTQYDKQGNFIKISKDGNQWMSLGNLEKVNDTNTSTGDKTHSSGGGRSITSSKTTKWIVNSKDGAYVYPVPRCEGQCGFKPYKTVVTQYDKKGNFIKISKDSEQWMSTGSLKKVKNDKGKSTTKTEKASTVENTDIALGDDNLKKGNAKTYNKMLMKYYRAFGAPPTFSKEVDPNYGNTIGKNIGRCASELYANPSIVSIQAGTVDYLPGFSKKNKNNFFKYVKSLASGDKTLASAIKKESKLNGQLYAFKSKYAKYMNVVNAMCRMSALFLGIGDEKMPGTKKKLKNFDYGYFTVPEEARGGKGSSIFAETKRAFNTAVTDNAYIHFYINDAAPAVNENMSTTTMKSQLEEAFNESGISTAAKNLQYIMGGPMQIDAAAESDIAQIIKDAGSAGNFLKNFAKLTKNYLKGGRLIFPQMIDDVSYEKSISVTSRFVSIYGDKKSIFLRTIVPVIHLIALSTPLQVSGNMYTYPFICRVTEPGLFNTDLAVISNLRIKRGGNDDMNWSTDGLPTEIEVTFDVTPLYSKLMLSSASHPFLFLQNTSMMEYLGVMCGVDLKANNFKVKQKLARTAIINKFTDIPINLPRGIVDSKLMANISSFLKITK